MFQQMSEKSDTDSTSCLAYSRCKCMKKSSADVTGQGSAGGNGSLTELFHE